MKTKVRSPKAEVRRREAAKYIVSSLRSKVRSPADGRAAAVGYLARFLCAGLALALLAAGCAGPRPLKGGKAVTTREPAGVNDQTLLQGENPTQATKQTQETVKVRTYTVPAGSRVERSQPPAAAGRASAVGAKTRWTARGSQGSRDARPPEGGRRVLVGEQDRVWVGRGGGAAGIAGVPQQIAEARAAQLLRAAIRQEHVAVSAMHLAGPGRRLGASNEVGAQGDRADIAIASAGNGVGQVAAGRLPDDVTITHDQHLRIAVLRILADEERDVRVGQLGPGC